MPDPGPPPRQGAELNPALKKRIEETHDTSKSSLAPVATASVQREEGKAWPMIWLVVTIVCVLIAIYLVVL
jgi:hypothetical protein